MNTTDVICYYSGFLFKLVVTTLIHMLIFRLFLMPSPMILKYYDDWSSGCTIFYTLSHPNFVSDTEIVQHNLSLYNWTLFSKYHWPRKPILSCIKNILLQSPGNEGHQFNYICCLLPDGISVRCNNELNFLLLDLHFFSRQLPLWPII